MKKIAAMFLVLSVLAPWGMRPAFANDEETAAELKKLEAKQDQILQEMAELKSELQIVKIRVSSR